MAELIGLPASVVLSTLPNPTIDLVIPATVPVKVGDAIGAFASSAVWVAELTGLFASLVLSTLPRPTIDLVIPATVPVNVGLSNGALPLRDVAIVALKLASAPSASLNSFSVSSTAGAPPMMFVSLYCAYVLVCVSLFEYAFDCSNG